MMKYFFFLFCAIQLSLFAKQPYQATFIVNGQSASVSAPNLLDLKRDLRSEEIQELIPFYTPISPVTFDINLRGIEVEAFFPFNSTTFVVSIPKANITRTFTAATRDDSITLFKEYLRDAHPRLLRAYARYSPIDPIAGNPNSLLSQMGQQDYLVGRLYPLSGCDCFLSQPIVSQLQLGINLGRTFAGGYDTTIATLPLRYSYSPDLNRALIIDIPLTYLRNGGASSLITSLGIGYRFPLFQRWSLTPIVRFGSGGSLDLATSGSFVSAGLVSSLDFPTKTLVFSLSNYASTVHSTNLWLSGVNFNYRLHTYILKNGFSITSCDTFDFFNRPLNFSVGFIDSYFGSNRLYIRHYDECSFSIIVNKINPCLCYDTLSLGFSFQFGQHNYRGYFINLIYQF